MAATLRRLAECDPQPNELIVVEQSAEVDPQVEEALKLFGGLGILVRQGRPNAQVARNRAAQLARSEVLLFLDDDVDPDENLIGAHLENYRDPSIHAVCGFYTEKAKTSTDQKRKKRKLFPLTEIEEIPPNFHERIESYLWPSCNGSILRKTFYKIGGFDENFRYTLYDDTDLSVRLKKFGYKAIHDPKCVLKHLKEPTGGKRPETRADIWSIPKWYTVLYFLIGNFGIASFFEILLRIRSQILNKNIFLEIKKPIKSAAYFFMGMFLAICEIQKGKKLIAKEKI